MAEDKDTEKKINQLQLYEQSLQNILLQKQQFQNQVTEFDSALSELKKSSESYRIIGNIMVKADSEELKKDLETKKSKMELRIKTLDTQETNIQEKVEKLQSDVMSRMKEND